MIRLQCLQESFISFSRLNKDWKWDKRYPEQAIQRFIAFNREIFSFLGISAMLDEVNYEKGLRLTASNYVGAAPLRNPLSGKYYTDIQVSSRFGENISELAYLLRDTLEPEYLDKALYNSAQLRAPFYFDCINYFNSFLRVIQEPWNKFDTITKVESHPCSSTDWSRYVRYAVNPNNVLKFENRKHILSRKHKEWQELIFVLNMAIREFDSFKTPLFLKQRYASEVSLLKRFSRDYQSRSPASMFQIRTFEPIKIQELKENANKLLMHNTANNKSWRIDSAELFERYVQYILNKVGKISGARVLCNSKFPMKGVNRPAWLLSYLEPDVILDKEGCLYFADAKYKAHMFNLQSSSDVFKESFRNDLHQVLAYSSLDPSKDKAAMLIYPCNKLKIIRFEAINNIGDVHNQVYLIGLPFITVALNDLLHQLSELLRK